MLNLEKCDSLKEGQQPLLVSHHNKQTQLNQYISSFYSYQSFVSSTNKIFLAYFLAHIIISFVFSLQAFQVISTATATQYFLIVPELLWAGAVILFKTFLHVEDPHSIGQKRIKIFLPINPIHLLSADLLIVAASLIVRNVLFSYNYFLLVVDLILNAFSLKIILQAYNWQREVVSILNSIQQQKFYVVPVIQVHLMEEPFQTHPMQPQKNINTKLRVLESPLKKYFKPTKPKQQSTHSEDDPEIKTYSH